MIIRGYKVHHVSKKLSRPLPNAVYALEYIEHVFWSSTPENLPA